MQKKFFIKKSKLNALTFVVDKMWNSLKTKYFFLQGTVHKDRSSLPLTLCETNNNPTLLYKQLLRGVMQLELNSFRHSNTSRLSFDTTAFCFIWKLVFISSKESRKGAPNAFKLVIIIRTEADPERRGWLITMVFGQHLQRIWRGSSHTLVAAQGRKVQIKIHDYRICFPRWAHAEYFWEWSNGQQLLVLMWP